MTTLTTQDAAAAALVTLLPTQSQLRPASTSSMALTHAQLSTAVVATFVGSPSCDLAIVLVDLTAAALGGATAVSSADLLTPALEAASAAVGVGVLGAARIEDATGLFADDRTSVFELLDGDTVAGWFAVRVRENGAASGAAAPSEASVSARLGRINDVEMALTVEIGRTRMPVRDVLSLEPGAVIELDRSAGAPADILLNGRLIAHGEVVVVDQDYAVRVTRILDVNDGLS